MSEILFRSKRMYDDEWVEGYLVKTVDGECMILPVTTEFWGGVEFSKGYHCDPAKVGQYTGENDKNGNKIFEGDIVKGEDHLVKCLEVYGYVDHQNGSFVIVGDYMTHCRWLDYDVEIVGNIHDNPDLIGRDD